MSAPMPASSPPSCIVLTLGDVSFDWLWFDLSPEESKKRRDGQKKQKRPVFNWMNRQQVVTVALHGGAWYVDNFVRMLLGPTHGGIAYSYRRFHSHYLRAGEYTQIIHADTGYRLMQFIPCLPDKATPVKVVKSVYRAWAGPTYFGPLEADVKRPKVKGVPWEQSRPDGDLKREEEKLLQALAKDSPATFVHKAFGIDHYYPSDKSTILVLHDESNGFSRDPKNWSEVLPDGGGSQVEAILLNLDLVENLHEPPMEAGKTWDQPGPEPNRLWHHLSKNRLLERTVVILSADDLRWVGVRISKSLSWERTAHDFLTQMRSHPDLRELARARHVIVRFDVSGVIHYRKDGDKDHCRLYYHPEHLESEYRRPDHGKMYGYNAILTATLAADLHSAFTEAGAAKAMERVDQTVGESARRGLANSVAYFRHGLGDRALDLHMRLEQEWDHIGGPDKPTGAGAEGSRSARFPPVLTELGSYPFSRERVEQKHVFGFELAIAEPRHDKKHFFSDKERPAGVDDMRRYGGEPVYLECIVEELAQIMQNALQGGDNSPWLVQRGISSMAGRVMINLVLRESSPIPGDPWKAVAEKIRASLTSEELANADGLAKQAKEDQALPDELNEKVKAWALARAWVKKVYDRQGQWIDWFYGWPVCIHAFAEGYKNVAQVDVADNPDWHILAGDKGQLFELARDIVRFGADKAFRQRAASAGAPDQRFPVARFGKLVSVDRKEMESYRSIRNLMREYLDRARPSRPLSIAVFGPPGSGKSFGVKEIAASIDPKKSHPLEYNLSQFNAPEELVNALVVTRDTGIEGKVPLVFFDEFDTAFGGEPLGWLRYFLSVMQDGTYRFRDQQLRIGPAILVFAGGTSQTYRDFSREGVLGPRLSEFQKAKGPDFVSRLRGYVDIIGPNPRDENDSVFIIRRAITLHSLLNRHYSHLIEGRDEAAVDQHVRDTLLKVERYKHGTRSIEAILEMCTLSGASRFHKAALPSSEQLEMHLKKEDAERLEALLDGRDGIDPDIPAGS